MYCTGHSTIFQWFVPFSNFSQSIFNISNAKFYNFGSSTFKTGQAITEVHLIHNNVYQFIGEAFVMFETNTDIEMALGNVIKENKKIHDKHVKVYRSSQEQFQWYCDTNAITKVSICIQNGEIVPMENLGSYLLANSIFYATIFVMDS